MSEQTWRLHLGAGPLVAAAIHAGSELRAEVEKLSALSKASRLREEDPFTDVWTGVAPTRVVGLRSRFEVDLNRPRENAVYRRPEDAWGLDLWKSPIPDAVVDRSLAEYDAFYRSMHDLLSELRATHGRFVLFDLHTYNHRREGPAGPCADPQANPQVNIGTGTMNRARWAPLVDRFVSDLRAFDFPGGSLDVRENVKFRGGQLSRWVHETFPDDGCAIAIEFKKFFMDEWTGEPDRAQVEAIRAALESTVPGVLAELGKTTGLKAVGVLREHGTS